MAIDLTAEINARLGASVKVEADKLLKRMSITAPIEIKITGAGRKTISKMTDTLKGLNAELKSVAVNSRLASTGLQGLNKAFSSIGNSSRQLNQTVASTQKVTKTTKEATDQVAEFGRVAGLALRRNAGFIIATSAIYGLGRAITSSFSEAVRFEKELVKVAQVSNRSVGSLQPLVNEITKLSTGLGVASSDLIDISLILAQAGLSANETRQALEALAKTTLAATFGDIRDTTEGAIALMSQFEISAKDLSKALGATNAVSAAFAVESEDIIAAVKRSGGVFAQTSQGVSKGVDAFNEFIAVFSAVRSTTRESAESIATGLRTIFTRIQRPQTIAFLKELGISLTDVEGKFVGPFEAVNRLSAGLQNVDRRGSTFARVSEELGGFRQIGKTLALLASSEQRIQALQVAQEGQNSVNKDAVQAQISLANAIARTREEFTALIREIAQTTTFDTMVRSVIGLANGMITLARTIKPIIPLIAVLGAVKGFGLAARFLPDFKKGLGVKLAKGGNVHGGKGGIDDIPAMLTAGEFVINKKSAAMIGKRNLEDLNRVGFAKGGAVGRVKMAVGGDPRDELEQLRKLDERLGKGEGAVKERARLLESIRQKTLRNQTENAKFNKLFSGSPTPRFEANLSGGRVSANSGQNLVGELSQGRAISRQAQGQDVRAEKNERRKAGNRDFNAAQAELQKKELAHQETINKLRQKQIQAHKAIVDNLANESRKSDNRKFNQRQEVLQQQEQRFAVLRDKDRQDTFRDRRLAAGPTISANQIQRTLESRSSTAEGKFQNASLLPLSRDALLAEQNSNFLAGASPIRNKNPLLKTRLVAGLQSRFPDFSNFLARDKVKGAGAAIKNNLKGAGGIAVLAGGALLGEKIGGKTGGTVSGAAAGAAIGALGGPVGIAVGGIVGAFNGFLQADFDQRIKTASDSMVTSIDGIETAINKFDSNISKGKKLEDALKELQEASKGSVQAAINTSRADQGLGLIGRQAQGVNSERIVSSDKESFFGQSKENALTQNKKGASGFQKFVNTVFGGAGAPSLGLGEDELIESFNTIQNQSAPASQAAEKAFNAQVERGVSFDDAFKNLSSDEKINLAIGRAKTRDEKLALGQAINTEDEIFVNSKTGKETRVNRSEEFLGAASRSQILGGSSRREHQEEQKANQIRKEGAEALAKINTETDLFIERLNNLSAVLDRVSQAGDGFRQQNESILSRRGGGAGIVSQARTNVFDNSRAFTTAEIASEARNLNSALGNNANSREFTSSIISAKKLDTELPRVLNELNQKISISGNEEGRKVLPELINKNFGGLPAVLRDKLTEDINKQFLANQQASPNDIAQELSAGNISNVSGNITKSINDTAKKLTDVLNKNITEFEQALDTWVGLVEEGNRAEDNRTQIMISNANIEKQLSNKTLTVADRSAGFNSQLSALAGRANSGTSVRSLFETEDNANSERFVQRTGPADEIAKNFAALSQQQQNSLKALELIAGNTDRQVALQQDLNGLIDSRKAARQIFEDFQFGTPTEKREIERSITLARQQLDGQVLSPTQNKQAREGQRLLSTLTGAVQGEDAVRNLDQRFIDVLDRGDSRRLFDVAGVNPGVGVGGLLNNRDELFQNRFRQLQGVNQEQQQAAGAITEINRRDANQFLQNGQDKFNAVQNGLQEALASGGLLDKLNETLQSIPESIEIAGNLSVNFNINGAEALNQLQPWAVQLVTTEVNRQMNQRLNPFTGESNPA